MKFDNIKYYARNVAFGLWFLGVTSVYPVAIILDFYKHTEFIKDCYNSLPCKIQRYGVVSRVYYNGRWISDYNGDGIPDDVCNSFGELSLTTEDLEAFKVAISLDQFLKPNLKHTSALETISLGK